MPVKCSNKSKKVKTREFLIEDPRRFLNLGDHRNLPAPRDLDCFEDDNYFFSDDEEDEIHTLAPRKKIVPSIEYLMNSIASWQWAEIDNVRLPVVIRDGIQYAAVVMVQVNLLSKFPYGISDDALKKHKQAMISKRMTEMEACLFNCVNACSRKFNLGFHMYSVNDEIVTLAEVVQFYFQLKEHFLHNLTEQYMKEEAPSSTSAKQSSDSNTNTDSKINSSSKSIMASIRDRCKEIHSMNIKDMISNEDFFTKLGEKLMKSENAKDLIPPKYCTGFQIPNEHSDSTIELEQGWMRLKDHFDGKTYSVHGLLNSATLDHASTELAVLERMQRSVLKRIVLQRASRAMFVKTKYTDHLKTLHDKLKKSLDDSLAPPFDLEAEPMVLVVDPSPIYTRNKSTEDGATTSASASLLEEVIPGSSSAMPIVVPTHMSCILANHEDIPAQADVPSPAAAPIPASATVPVNPSTSKIFRENDNPEPSTSVVYDNCEPCACAVENASEPSTSDIKNNPDAKTYEAEPESSASLEEHKPEPCSPIVQLPSESSDSTVKPKQEPSTSSI